MTTTPRPRIASAIDFLVASASKQAADDSALTSHPSGDGSGGNVTPTLGEYGKDVAKNLVDSIPAQSVQDAPKPQTSQPPETSGATKADESPPKPEMNPPSDGTTSHPATATLDAKSAYEQLNQIGNTLLQQIAALGLDDTPAKSAASDAPAKTNPSPDPSTAPAKPTIDSSVKGAAEAGAAAGAAVAAAVSGQGITPEQQEFLGHLKAAGEQMADNLCSLLRGIKRAEDEMGGGDANPQITPEEVEALEELLQVLEQNGISVDEFAQMVESGAIPSDGASGNGDVVEEGKAAAAKAAAGDDRKKRDWAKILALLGGGAAIGYGGPKALGAIAPKVESAVRPVTDPIGDTMHGAYQKLDKSVGDLSRGMSALTDMIGQLIHNRTTSTQPAPTQSSQGHNQFPAKSTSASVKDAQDPMAAGSAAGGALPPEQAIQMILELMAQAGITPDMLMQVLAGAGSPAGGAPATDPMAGGGGMMGGGGGGMMPAASHNEKLARLKAAIDKARGN